LRLFGSNPPVISHTDTAAGWFKTTHWSAVLNAAGSDTREASVALSELCQAYWPPLYAYVRRTGYNKEDAQDLTQEFFARLLEKQWLNQADRQRGKFRSFLLSSMNHFLANEWRRSQTAKRGGGKAIVSLDDTAEALCESEWASCLTPEKLYERSWAMALFERAIADLQAIYTADGKSKLYNALKDFLSSEAGDGDYARIGKELEMSNGAVAAAVHRMRQRYREVVRAQVARTVANDGEVEEEMRSLLAALQL
jgi:RNA polymerase sigma factor (sigma-70 family)